MVKPKVIIEQIIQNEIENALVLEGIKPNVSLTINGKIIDFGSKEHILDLKRLLVSLESLKNCYSRGTANRHVYSTACSKVRRLIKKLISDLLKNRSKKATTLETK